MIVPKSHAEADQLLRRKCEIATRLKRITARMEDAIRKATQIAAVESAELKVEDARIDRTLKSYFATLAPEALGERKSVKLNFGTFGKRAKEKVVLVRGWLEETAMAALKARFPRFVRVREEVMKSAILELDPEGRAEVEQAGWRVDRGETFYVEPDLKDLADYPSRDSNGAVVIPAGEKKR